LRLSPDDILPNGRHPGLAEQVQERALEHPPIDGMTYNQDISDCNNEKWILTQIGAYQCSGFGKVRPLKEVLGSPSIISFA